MRTAVGYRQPCCRVQMQNSYGCGRRRPQVGLDAELRGAQLRAGGEVGWRSAPHFLHINLTVGKSALSKEVRGSHLLTSLLSPQHGGKKTSKIETPFKAKIQTHAARRNPSLQFPVLQGWGGFLSVCVHSSSSVMRCTRS